MKSFAVILALVFASASAFTAPGMATRAVGKKAAPAKTATVSSWRFYDFYML